VIALQSVTHRERGAEEILRRFIGFEKPLCEAGAVAGLNLLPKFSNV
jgi:hypothetical protein